MKPSYLLRPLTVRLAGSALFALVVTGGAVAQQDQPPGQRGGAAATSSGQGRSSSPARPSGSPRTAAPADQEPVQPRARAGTPKPKEAAGAEPGAKPTASKAGAKAAGDKSTSEKPSAAKPSAAKPSAVKPGGAAPAGAPGGAQATLLDTFDDWGAYATPAGRSRVCYALSQPTERTPKSVAREPAYLFVSFRPSENIRNEIALVMGFATKDGGEAQATIGNTSYGLVTKGSNAWVKNPAEEGQVITTMSRASSVTVKATSGRGNATSDRYSLKGFGKALEKAREECKAGAGA